MIDQIILSTNEDETYIHFWKPIAWAYRKIFPEVKIRLAFLTDKTYDDPLVKEFQEYGDVTLFPIIPDVPEFSQAKMIRFVLAAMQGTDVCYIDDIDLFPLVKSFITDKTDKRPKGHLLCVGGEVYNNNGCYPVSQMTAEGYIWAKFINPNGLAWPEVMETYKKPWRFDKREDIMSEVDFAKDVYFSDERLIRRLLKEISVPKFEMARGYESSVEGILDKTIDRMTWDFSEEKLMNHGYFNAHGARPFREEDYVLLRKYIETYY